MSALYFTIYAGSDKRFQYLNRELQMNYLQWLMFSLFFAIGFTTGYLRGKAVGMVEGYLRHRAVNRHISNLVRK